MTCGFGGVWSASELDCTEDACPELVLGSEYAVQCSGTGVGHVCAVSCAPNYAADGLSLEARTCARGAWSTQRLECKPAPCGELEVGEGFVATGSYSRHGDSRTVVCAAGYASVGAEPELVTCQFGVWAARSLQCEPRECAKLQLGEAYSVACAGFACAVACAPGFTSADPPEVRRAQLNPRAPQLKSAHYGAGVPPDGLLRLTVRFADSRAD